jgi:hypothetical protein
MAASAPNLRGPWISMIRSALPRTRRFIMDENAARRAGEIVRAAEGMMLSNAQFALPPFPDIYLEMNSHVFLQAAGKAQSSPTDLNGNPTDHMVGFLMTGDNLYVVAAGQRSETGLWGSGFAPWFYKRGGGRDDYIPAAGQDQYLGKAILLLGSSIHSTDEPVISEIAGNWRIRQLFPQHPQLYTKKANTLTDCAGDVRTLICLLLILNQPRHLKLLPVGPRRGIRGGRPVVYAAHSVVSLELGTTREWVKLLSVQTDRSSPRRHEVRGHFRNVGGRDACEHVWPTEPTTSEWSSAPVWTCTACGRRRIWLHAHERGDASRGFVTKHYEVC